MSGSVFTVIVGNGGPVSSSPETCNTSQPGTSTRSGALAGEYYSGDGLGSNRSLKITPRRPIRIRVERLPRPLRLQQRDCRGRRGGGSSLSPKKINLRRIGLLLSELGPEAGPTLRKATPRELKGDELRLYGR